MKTAPRGGPEIVLDLSRLLSRVLHTTPTGVDRCEMAYARGLLAAVPDRLWFGATHPSGFYGRLPRAVVERFLDATEARWDKGGSWSGWQMRYYATGVLAALRPRFAVLRTDSPRVYLQASPNNLTRPKLVGSILRREKARFVCLLHDLIPLQYPEYARPDGAALHARRIETMVAFADGIVANSSATLNALQPYLAHGVRTPATVVAHLGTESRFALSPYQRRAGLPYFVCIGTIEPRKNHLLLLNIWRKMAELRGAKGVPRLFLIGRRGWENEQVVDMLERCTALRGCVEELGALPDTAAQALLSGACALLLPSFAEGYGMPVCEALSLGVPVICSDLPALREAGGDVPEYLDPLDGPAWLKMIDNFVDRSSRADLQHMRRRTWSVPTWDSHIDRVLDLAEHIV